TRVVRREVGPDLRRPRKITLALSRAVSHHRALARTAPSASGAATGFRVAGFCAARWGPAFGWMKTVANFRKTRFRGFDANHVAAYMVAAACGAGWTTRRATSNGTPTSWICYPLDGPRCLGWRGVAPPGAAMAEGAAPFLRLPRGRWRGVAPPWRRARPPVG